MPVEDDLALQLLRALLGRPRNGQTLGEVLHVLAGALGADGAVLHHVLVGRITSTPSLTRESGLVCDQSMP